MTQKKFNLSSFLLGILLLITGAITLYDPMDSLIAIVMVFAITAIIEGVIHLVFRKRLKEYSGYKSYTLVAIGILDIIIGIFLLFNIYLGLVALPYVFAIWFILDSLGEVILSDVYRTINSTFYWIKLILNLLGIVLGFILLFNPIASALTLTFIVGFYFIISGIDFILNSV